MQIHRNLGDALKAERIVVHAEKYDKKPVTKGSSSHRIQNVVFKKYAFCIIELPMRKIPKENNKVLAKVMGLKLDEYGFFKSKDQLTAPLDTNVPGIYICGCCQSPKDIPESVAQASGAAARAAETIMCSLKEAK